MSRAFVKESDDDAAADALPERALPEHMNYVTPSGLARLQQTVRELTATHEGLKPLIEEDTDARRKMREIERDLRYFRSQLERATLVDPANQPRDEVHFGAVVTIEDEEGASQVFSIVGDDEADVAAGKISWASPLARAMMSAKVGDTVAWHRPVGVAQVHIAEIRYL
ncbi:MAG: GreA/GreB family elongation factor [Pseudomonadota bacterium]